MNCPENVSIIHLDTIERKKMSPLHSYRPYLIPSHFSRLIKNSAVMPSIDSDRQNSAAQQLRRTSRRYLVV